MSSLPRSPRLPFPYRPESDVVASHLQALVGALDWPAVSRPPGLGFTQCAATRRRFGPWKAC